MHVRKLLDAKGWGKWVTCERMEETVPQAPLRPEIGPALPSENGKPLQS